MNTHIQTTSEYWDCECNTNYIHPRAISACPVCGCVKDDQPDSIVSEVIKAGFGIANKPEWSAEEIIKREG